MIWTEQTPRILLVSAVTYGLGIGIYYSTCRKTWSGEEHGSALWADARSLYHKYRDKLPQNNILLTRSFILGLDSRRHHRNLNVLVVGGSGSGKFMYIRDDKDVLKSVTNLIRNTTSKGANTNDLFWEKSETTLLQALMLYLIHEPLEGEQNFSMVMEMLQSAEVREDNEDYKSPLDVLFDRLED